MEVLVLFDSRGGNVYALAKAIVEGVESVEGMTARLRRPHIVTPIEVIRAEPSWSMFYDRLVAEVPEVTHDDMVQTEGLALGSPTRYGNMTASMSNFIESLGPLWISGALVGKVAGVFTSTGTMHGGQETTLISMMMPLMHLGYIIVPMGYTDLGVQRTTRGGTPYGPSSVSGPGADQGPDECELSICRAFGRRLAETTKRLRG